MRLAVITGCVYLVLTGLRLFCAALLSALSGSCAGCPGCGAPAGCRKADKKQARLL